MESKKQQKREAFQDAWRTKRSVTLVYILLRASVILVMLAQIFNRNFDYVFLCVLTLFLFMVPSMLERKLDIALPNTLEIIILLFIYAAEIMGEIGAYYVTFPYWDTVLHTLNGFLCAAIGFSLLDTMKDLFVNFIGALTFSIIGYFYVRSRGKGKFAKRFIPMAKNSAMPDVSEMAETKIPAKKEDTIE